MPNTRYLTKSRFKIATECPTKLFYADKPDIYPDQSTTDPFLSALAEGGFQVGELAKAYHPAGIQVLATDPDAAWEETQELLKQENVTLFEAAIRFGNLFIRIDILKKEGNVFDLIEVKAKSFGHKKELIGKRSGKIAPEWKPYIMDVAFQEVVLKSAFPDAVVRPRLMLANKTAKATVDGLNQKFSIQKDENGRAKALANGDVSPEALGDEILTKLNVHQHVKQIREDKYLIGNKGYTFSEYIDELARIYAEGERVPPKVDCGICGKCSFRASVEEEQAGKKNGYKECWQEAKGFSNEDFDRPSIMDIWKFNKKQAFLKVNKYFMTDLEELDFDATKPTQQRQWLQVQKTLANDRAPWIDIKGLKEEISSWTWPLHFIDFETSNAAIPFSKGCHPYETLAFQFSHHMVHEDGRVEHADEFLKTEGFPNVEFVRYLKAGLEKDAGTIFRYGAHENTVLNHIKEQLLEAGDEISDRQELIRWIGTITYDDKGNRGPRNMVDMLDLVQSYYYQLDMGGSNSIKKVLPAVLNSSATLQKKYAEPTYNSANYSNQVWIQRDESGRVKDPYKLLPQTGSLEQEKLADGGAALTAYARLQFTDISEADREAICQALLRYCELDTLAMVMIWEAWRAELV
jgi:hypothetical protein